MNLRPLTPHITSCYALKMPIVSWPTCDVTSSYVYTKCAHNFHLSFHLLDDGSTCTQSRYETLIGSHTLPVKHNHGMLLL